MLSGIPFKDLGIAPGDARLDNKQYEEPIPQDSVGPAAADRR